MQPVFVLDNMRTLHDQNFSGYSRLDTIYMCHFLRPCAIAHNPHMCYTLIMKIESLFLMPTINLLASGVAIECRIRELQKGIKKRMAEDDFVDRLEDLYPATDITPSEKATLRARTQIYLLRDKKELQEALVWKRIIQAIIIKNDGRHDCVRFI